MAERRQRERKQQDRKFQENKPREKKPQPQLERVQESEETTSEMIMHPQALRALPGVFHDLASSILKRDVQSACRSPKREP